MAQKTVPSDDDLLEYARRMEKHFESFQYLKEVLQAVYDAKASLPRFQAESAAAEQAMEQAVLAAQGKVSAAQAAAEKAQLDFDAKVKGLDVASNNLETLHGQRVADLQAAATAAAKSFEYQKAKYLPEIEKIKKQLESDRADFETKKSDMTAEIVELQSKIDALNKIMIGKRDAVLALAGSVQ